MYSLLIVDDEEYIADGLLQLFEEVDLPLKRVSCSYSAAKALEMLARHPYAIIISDIKMPGMDGLVFLEQVRQANPRTQFILLTGYDYFEYARKAIRLRVHSYLLKAVEDEDVVENVAQVTALLDREVQEALAIRQMRDALGKSRLRERIHLVELVLKDSVDVQEILTRAGDRLPFRQEAGIGLVGIHIRGAVGKTDTARLDTALEAMRSLFGKLTGGELILQRESAAMAVGIFQAAGQERGSFLAARFEEIQDALHREQGILSSIGIVRHLQWGELRGAYRDMLVYLRQNIQPGQILQVDSHIRYARDEKLMSHLEEMLSAIGRLDRRRFLEHLDQVVALSASEEKFTGGLAYFYLKLSQSILDIAFDNNITGLISTENVEKLTNLSSFGSMEEFRDFLVRAYTLLEEGRDDGHPSNQLVSSIQYYIQGNLGEELSLDYLARKFRINPSYLSRVFREAAGQNLSNYISSQKVVRAKQIMMKSDCRIGNIAEQLGYQNANYFARVFRKLTGISPQEYRQALGKNYSS